MFVCCDVVVLLGARNELCVWVDGFRVRFSSVRIVRFVRFGSFVSVRSFRSFRFVQVLFVCLFWSQECVLARALLLRYFRLGGGGRISG